MQTDQPPRIPPLRAVRQAQGLTLREAARRAGIEPAQLSRVERGRGVLGLEALARLAKVLELRQLHRHLSQYLPDEPTGGLGNRG